MIICAGMSRSGGTVQYQMVAAVMEKQGYRAAGFPGRNRGKVVIKSEPPAERLLALVNRGDARVVTVYRDPRDVAASLWTWGQRRASWKPDGQYVTWPDVCQKLELALEWFAAWEKLAVHVACYDERWFYGWAADLVEMAAKLDVALSMDEAQVIEERFSIDHNLERQGKLDVWMEPAQTMLTAAHIGPQRGRPGQWMQVLNVSQVMDVEALAGQWMEAHGYRRVVDRIGD